MSVNHRKYTLVIVDEYSRYTWAYFLRKKSHATKIIMSFIKMVENQNDVKDKQIRTNNRTEFKNYELESFCNEKGISHNFSSPYTPKQNGVAERKNRTLIEAARTMLNGSIFIERIPDINYFHVFGCLVFIHNHKDHLEVIAPNEQDNPHNEVVEGLPDQENTEGTQEQIVQNEQINQPTEESSKNNTKILVHITESLVPKTLQSWHASTSSYPVAQDRWSQNQHIELVNIIGDPGKGMLTRSMAVKLTTASANECLFADFLSKIEPKRVSEALKHPRWVDAMQEELNQLYRNKVWTLVSLPHGKIAIGSKWVFRNKKDEHGIVTKNKARLVAQGYSQEEGTHYDETFATVARMEALRIFFAFATYMNFIVFQMDVKSAFLNRKLKEEVYVKQPPGFESSEFPNYVCKLDKALYGLKQAPKACSSVKTPMVPPNNLGPDLDGKPVNETLYKGMIGSLMYLTTTRHDIQFFIILCARYQSCPKESHLIAVKRIFRYLKSIPSLGLYYPKCSRFDLKGYSDSNYAGCNMDKKAPQYVAHPSLEVVKAELAKIVTNLSYLDKTHVLKNSFLVAWRILFTFVIQVLDGNYSSTEQINSSQQMIAFCLMTGIKVDIGEIIYSDLVTKFTNKSRQKYVSHPRFVSCALEVLLGTQYTQDENFRGLHGILMSPLPLSGKKKKVKSQTVTPTLPKSQGSEASGALSKKRQKPKSKKTPTEDQGTRKSQPLHEGTTTNPKDSRGNVQPADKRLPFMISDKGTIKTTSLPKGPHGDKDSEGFKPPADMKPLTTHVADPLGGVKRRVGRSLCGMGWTVMESVMRLRGLKFGMCCGVVGVREGAVRVGASDESDSDSSCPAVLKKYENILPLTERQLHKEAVASYAALRASVEGYYDENVDHMD
ncbi:retrovirus-related pol polyprotein from transposon TNT 1-94 [Tanacetum coccineum]